LLDSFVAVALHQQMRNAPDLIPAKRTEQAAQQERLAKALRDNLRRRKQQQRAQDEIKARQSQQSDPESEPPA
jgi:uncharacterized membrane protein YccC